MEKICTSCGTTKPVTDFYKGQTHCKPCYKARYNDSPEHKARAKVGKLKLVQAKKAESSVKYKHYCNMNVVKSTYGILEQDLQDFTFSPARVLRDL